MSKKKSERNKLDNKIKLIKYLHKPRTYKECQDYLEITKNTLINYINETKETIDNVEIPLYLNREKKEYTSKGEGSSRYEIQSSVHPIILPLNLTEVYMLTRGLLDIIGENSDQYLAYKHIVEKIYSQLSDYAIETLNNNGKGFEGLDLKKLDKISFESEVTGKPDIDIMYYFKANKPLQITINNEVHNCKVVLENNHFILIDEQGLRHFYLENN